MPCRVWTYFKAGRWYGRAGVWSSAYIDWNADLRKAMHAFYDGVKA